MTSRSLQVLPVAPHAPMEDSAFEGWLDSVSSAFLTLSDQQRNRTLDRLISQSGAAQLRHLSTGLETLLKRDFLRLLPLELTFYLLRWLDPRTLLTCCRVCKHWNKVGAPRWRERGSAGVVGVHQHRWRASVQVLIVRKSTAHEIYIYI